MIIPDPRLVRWMQLAKHSAEGRSHLLLPWEYGEGVVCKEAHTSCSRCAATVHVNLRRPGGPLSGTAFMRICGR